MVVPSHATCMRVTGLVLTNSPSFASSHTESDPPLMKTNSLTAHITSLPITKSVSFSMRYHVSVILFFSASYCSAFILLFHTYLLPFLRFFFPLQAFTSSPSSYIYIRLRYSQVVFRSKNGAQLKRE